MIYDHRSDTHDSIERVNLYACPNLGAVYTRDDIKATKWQGDYPECQVCGRTRGSFAVHHEPPRSQGSLLLKSPMGQFVVKPMLILLCEECHRDRHDRAELSFRWEWDSQGEEDMFLSGAFFYKLGFNEHDERFWNHGKLVVDSRGMKWEVRK